MILPTMNTEELVLEIMKDYPMVVRKAEHQMLRLRRLAIKSRNKHVQRIYYYKTNKNNNWLILCNYYAKDPVFVAVVHFLDNWGLHAYMVDANQRALTHYSEHFFERYNERFLHEPQMSKVDVLKRYISKNATASLKILPDTEKYKHPFFGRSREGVVLGFIEDLKQNSINHAKTFIANDMIFEGQQSSFDAAGRDNKQYWEEVYPKRNLDGFDD